MENDVHSKADELREAMHSLGKRLDVGDDSELLVWVIHGALACAHRPLRHHLRFGGSGRDLPLEATSEVIRWVHRIRDLGISAIITLMHPKELHHYICLDLGAENLIDFYQKSGFKVGHIPWEDPAHRLPSGQFSFQEELARIREEALQVFDELPKPVLLHCSAGIDRSSPIAAYIWSKRGKTYHHKG